MPSCAPANKVSGPLPNYLPSHRCGEPREVEPLLKGDIRGKPPFGLEGWGEALPRHRPSSGILYCIQDNAWGVASMGSVAPAGLGQGLATESESNQLWSACLGPAGRRERLAERSLPADYSVGHKIVHDHRQYRNCDVDGSHDLPASRSHLTPK